MSTVLVSLALLALVGYALQAQHNRVTRPLPRLAGSGPAVTDRDAERIDADLAALDPASEDRVGDRAVAAAHVGRAAHPVR
ncbi:hypothetical protein R8Z50_15530 [Longispora sp. K20-0274]|uniref:hypothetical protein n=1 Tax=Longispora sp. K20-0274 TaxID=3088255 RepID=UPI00399B7B8F